MRGWRLSYCDRVVFLLNSGGRLDPTSPRSLLALRAFRHRQRRRSFDGFPAFTIAQGHATRGRTQQTHSRVVSGPHRHAQGKFPARGALSCANLAHGFAGLEGHDKLVIKQIRQPNIGIVSSYNEMLSAHAPYKNYPDIIKEAARELAASRNSRAAYRPCATVSHKAMRAWSCRCSRAKSLR